MITKPLLKICGLMRPEDVSMCCRMGVDICGFVTEYPLTVPWNLTIRQCQKLIQRISSPTKSCIVTGGDKNRIVDLALALRPDYIQLHYKEKLEDVEFMVNALLHYNIKVIKTIPTIEEERLYQFGTEKPEECARKLVSAGVSVILIDSRGPSNAVMSGGTIDLSLYEKMKEAVTCPVMLGGGITSKNGRNIVERVHPDIIDVMTGVELLPGIKSEEMVSELIKSISF